MGIAESSSDSNEKMSCSDTKDNSNGNLKNLSWNDISSTKPCSDRKFRANKFLRVHLQILKALYNCEPLLFQSEESSVEDKFWTFIDLFLQERESCATLVKRAQRARGICEEAIQFQKHVLGSCVSDNEAMLARQLSPDVHHRTRLSNGSRSSGLAALITQPSPYFPSSQRRHGRWNVDPADNERIHRENDDSQKLECSSFGVVSGLLQRKHLMATRKLKQRTINLRTLVQESQRRIPILENSKRNVQERKHYSKEDHEDHLLRIETKLALWKLLHRDLLQTLSLNE